MRRLWRRWVVCGVVTGALCGCVSSTVSRHVVYQERCAKRFVELVRSGETTREEEQEYIHVNERAWHFLREAMGIEGAEPETKEAVNGK